MSWIKSNAASLILFVLIAAILMAGMDNVAGQNAEEQLRIAEDNVRKAVVSCYALEGRYPPDIQYLQEQYGLQLNEKKYTVHYEIFAENIMPEITVTER